MSHEQKIAPHVRLTAEDLKDLWLDKQLRSEAYLLMLLNAFKKPGFEITIDNVPAFCTEWELPTSTFYKAKAALTLAGKIDEIITGSVKLTVRSSGRFYSHPRELDSHPRELDSHPRELDSHPRELDSSLRELDSSLRESENREPLSSTAFNDSPTLSQLFTNSSNNLLTTNREEEEKKERKRQNPSPSTEVFVDCEILEEPDPIENLSSSLAIHTQLVARSENKTVPAAARGKKAIESDHVARVCATWNEHKAALWASIRIPPNPTRSKALLKFVESCGSIALSIEYLTGALTYMRDDEFWASKKLLTIENILSNNKIPQHYEKYMELKENPAIVAVAEKLRQMQEPKSFSEMNLERDDREGEKAVVNRMKRHPEEFEPEELAEYRAKYPNQFETVSSLNVEF